MIDTDIFFVLFNIPSKFLLYLELLAITQNAVTQLSFHNFFGTSILNFGALAFDPQRSCDFTCKRLNPHLTVTHSEYNDLSIVFFIALVNIMKPNSLC